MCEQYRTNLRDNKYMLLINEKYFRGGFREYDTFLIQCGEVWFVRDHGGDKHRLLHNDERIFGIHKRDIIDN